MALLDKSNIPEVASHIRNLKDVVELKLTVNPGYKPSDKADGYNDVQAAQYVCPVTGLEMSGRYRCMKILMWRVYGKGSFHVSHLLQVHFSSWLWVCAVRESIERGPFGNLPQSNFST